MGEGNIKWDLPEFGADNLLVKKSLRPSQQPKLTHAPTPEPQQLQQDFNKGVEQGYQKAITELQTIINAVNNLHQQLQQLQHELPDNISELTKKFIVTISSHFIQKQLCEEFTEFENIINQALEPLKDDKGAIDLYLHRDDLAVIDNFELQNSFTHLNIQNDPNLEPKTFRIEADMKIIKFDIKESIEKIFKRAD